MGFTDVVERLGFSYESEEAYDLIDEIMEYVCYAAIDESADLARERGSLPQLRGLALVAGPGALRHDRLTEADRGLPITVDRTIRLDWDALREKVKGGMRNATLMAIAPTASIGLVAGTTPGLDPQFSQIFSRTTSSGKFLEVNRNLVTDAQGARPVGAGARGAPARAGRRPGHRRHPGRGQGDVYKTQFQLSPYAFLEVAARAQKWIDQAISRNMYLETRDLGDMMDIYYAAWSRASRPPTTCT